MSCGSEMYCVLMKDVAADLHPHGLQEPDPEGRQGDEGQEGVANQIEQAIVEEPRHGVDRVVPSLKGSNPSGQDPVVDRYDDQQEQAGKEETQRRAGGYAEPVKRLRQAAAPGHEMFETPQRRSAGQTDDCRCQRVEQ